MKLLLLFLFFTPFIKAHAQPNQVAHLPAGTYQIQKNNSFKGDIVLLDDSHYKLSTESTVGEYKFSATAQRVLFLSGTLKGAFARTTGNSTDPIIVLPRKENEDMGFKLIQSDLQAFYKRN
jgi:hypothetical protein